MQYVLYFSPDSANIVVRMILEELGVTYEDHLVPRRRTERDAAFLKLNPRGLLPVLIDKATDLPVFETGAIALYLADKHRRLAPASSDLQARGDCLRGLFMLSHTLHADLRIRFYSDRYVVSPPGIPNLWDCIFYHSAAAHEMQVEEPVTVRETVDNKI